MCILTDQRKRRGAFPPEAVLTGGNKGAATSLIHLEGHTSARRRKRIYLRSTKGFAVSGLHNLLRETSAGSADNRSTIFTSWSAVYFKCKRVIDFIFCWTVKYHKMVQNSAWHLLRGRGDVFKQHLGEKISPLIDTVSLINNNNEESKQKPLSSIRTNKTEKGHLRPGECRWNSGVCRCCFVRGRKQTHAGKTVFSHYNQVTTS